MSTKVTGHTTSYYTSWYTYDVTTNNETTYTFNINLGVTSTKPTSATALAASGIHKKIGNGSWSNTNMGSTKTIKAKGDTTLISGHSWPVTKTHSTQTVTIEGSVNVQGSGGMAEISYVSKTFTIPAKTSYKVTYNANGGSGAPAAQTKWHGESLTLSTTKPTKSGYTFKGWAISEAKAKTGEPTYQSGVSYTYTGNAALTLWAVWELNYSKPTISNFDVKRCKSDGEIDDEGTYAKVVFDWSVFTSQLSRYYGGTDTPYSTNTVSNCVVTVGDESINVTLTGTSGHAEPSDVIGSGSDDPFDTDKQYNASVSITDTQEVQSAHTTTATDALPSTHFPLDFNSNATAMGVFCPAPDREGVFIGSSFMARGMAGMIQMFAGSTKPAGWLFCDGTVYNVSDYPELAEVLRSTYGGNGTTTFAVPDMRGRFPLGSNSSYPLNDKKGSADAVVVSHTHAPVDSGYRFMHAHQALEGGDMGSQDGTGRHYPYLTNRNDSAYWGTGTTTGGASGGVSGTGKNMPPYIGINFIIATGKTS